MPANIYVFSRNDEMTSEESRLRDSFTMKFEKKPVKLKILKGYQIDADIMPEDLEKAARLLFSDPIVEDYRIDDLPWRNFDAIITVGYKPGVTDNVGHTAEVALQDLGIFTSSNSGNVHFFKVYILWNCDPDSAKTIALELHNPIIEFAHVSNENVQLPNYNLSKKLDEKHLLNEIPITKASNDELLRISKEGLLALNLNEMKKIQEYYQILGREPTDIELETFAQTWSEHCVHKTLKGSVNFVMTKPDGTTKEERIENLLKSTIFAATNKIRKRKKDKDICVSVFKDNAGIIRFNERYNICFKVETHNHPSAKEPYGGAATGIGGVIRDILAAGIGAKPIANTDVFCFAEPNLPESKVPKGVINPEKIMTGVVAGVRDYGNPMGIPTVNGAVYFDNRYLGNPLVFCGTVGIIPRKIKGRPTEYKKPEIGDFLVVVGGKTGRDGIHGVTFASLEMDKHTTSNPVQIGDPITERMFMEAMFKARDENLYNFVQDCGGGGLSSAFGEIAKDLGCEIYLDHVPLKYQGLLPWEIWVSESQERQAFTVPPEKFDRFREIFENEDVGVYKIGRITGDKKLILKYKELVIGHIDMDFLHSGLPKTTNNAIWTETPSIKEDFKEPDDLNEILCKLLSSWNICSKEWIVRQYDTEVQGSTIIKPLQGIKNDGPGDGAVIKPDPESFEGIVITNGMNPKYSDLDPYWMVASGIDEAIRNAVCCGANPEHLALLDNFCWGDPRDPKKMGQLVLACKACHDMALGFDTPFISGKDSLNNEYVTDDGTISIPSTLLISAVGKIEDVRLAKTIFFKKPGNYIYIVGNTNDELGGSHYLEIIKKPGANTKVPRVHPREFKLDYLKIHEAIIKNLVISAHDCSEGGLAVSLAEMCFSGELGAKILLSSIPREIELARDDLILFSESNGRVIVEVPRDKAKEFEKLMEGRILSRIGEVLCDKRLIVVGLNGKKNVIDIDIEILKECWIKPLDLENNLKK
ncbi:MAG: phosphoribosylformylglycinamidine synthase subunit PurL [Promethearchaeota archaeon]